MAFAGQGGRRGLTPAAWRWGAVQSEPQSALRPISHELRDGKTFCSPACALVAEAPAGAGVRDCDLVGQPGCEIVALVGTLFSQPPGKRSPTDHGHPATAKRAAPNAWQQCRGDRPRQNHHGLATRFDEQAQHRLFER